MTSRNVFQAFSPAWNTFFEPSLTTRMHSHLEIWKTEKKLIQVINQNNKENAVDGKFSVINIYDIDEVTSTLRKLR